MDLVIFEQNKPFILEALGKGEFDYIEAAGEIFETDFFRFIKTKRILDKLSETYPAPRRKEDVPLWLYVARPISEAIIKREKKQQEKLHELKQQKPAPLPEEILVKREAAVIGAFRSWSSCTVPLTVVANREHYADGDNERWLLIDTKDVQDPSEAHREYHLRSTIEERYRQLKCFCDLTNFTSRAFSMVVNQVVFIMLGYDLLQLFLLRQGRKELNKRTPPHIRQQLLPSDNHIIVYCENYYGLFTPLEFAEIIATLGDEARKKVAGKYRHLGRELNGAMSNI